MVKVGDYVVTSKGYTGFVVSVSTMQTRGYASFAASFDKIVSIHIGSKNGRPIGVSDFAHAVTVLPSPAK